MESQQNAKPRSSSFKDAENFVRSKSGTFVRKNSDSHSPVHSRSGTGTSTGMPEFRDSIKAHLQKTKDAMPQGLMREVMETYKPHILGRRRCLIEDCVRDLRLNNDHIHIVEQEMRRSIEDGLKKETHDAASVKCWPTYVRKLPTGQERGKFLALDLGGTNFRVLALELTEEKEFLMDSKIYAIPQNIMTGPGMQLFDHIAECLSNFVHDREIEDEVLPLG